MTLRRRWKRLLELAATVREAAEDWSNCAMDGATAREERLRREFAQAIRDLRRAAGIERPKAA